MEITNADGDKLVGKLNNGAPDEGTKVFAATEQTKTGKWKEGISGSPTGSLREGTAGGLDICKEETIFAYRSSV